MTDRPRPLRRYMPYEVPKDLRDQLGPLAELLDEGRAWVTGGALIRDIYKLGRGADIDVIVAHDAWDRACELLEGNHATCSRERTEGMTSMQGEFRRFIERRVYEPFIRFGPGNQQVDLLRLPESEEQPRVVIEQIFEHFDGDAFTGVCGKLDGGRLGFWMTADCVRAIRNYSAGWRETPLIATSKERKEKWDALFALAWRRKQPEAPQWN